MKRLLLAGMILGLAWGQNSFAQEKDNRYIDGVYFTGSQAEQEAKEQAKEQEAQQSSNGTQYYNSSDPYNTDGNARVYNDGSYGATNDGYIDYDDDSYTSRIRRFQYPFDGVGYWGSVYDPYWMNPFYANPYYGWGGWYTPGISFSFGVGPYWTSYWGMNTWYGYGGFGSWYAPYGYYGWGGYGSGYWSGYYAGLYDGVGYYNPVRRANYGPRGARRNGYTGNYSRSSRTAPIYQNGTVTPQRTTVNNRNAERRATDPSVYVDQSRQSNREVRPIPNREARSSNIRVTPNQSQNTRGERSSRSIFNFNRTPSRNTPSRSVERHTPSRDYTPSRSYNPPSRSYSPPARSSGSPRSTGGSVHRR